MSESAVLPPPELFHIRTAFYARELLAPDVAWVNGAQMLHGHAYIEDAISAYVADRLRSTFRTRNIYPNCGNPKRIVVDALPEAYHNAHDPSDLMNQMVAVYRLAIPEHNANQWFMGTWPGHWLTRSQKVAPEPTYVRLIDLLDGYEFDFPTDNKLYTHPGASAEPTSKGYKQWIQTKLV